MVYWIHTLRNVFINGSSVIALSIVMRFPLLLKKPFLIFLLDRQNWQHRLLTNMHLSFHMRQRLAQGYSHEEDGFSLLFKQYFARSPSIISRKHIQTYSNEYLSIQDRENGGELLRICLFTGEENEAIKQVHLSNSELCNKLQILCLDIIDVHGIWNSIGMAFFLFWLKLDSANLFFGT